MAPKSAAKAKAAPQGRPDVEELPLPEGCPDVPALDVKYCVAVLLSQVFEVKRGETVAEVDPLKMCYDFCETREIDDFPKVTRFKIDEVTATAAATEKTEAEAVFKLITDEVARVKKMKHNVLKKDAIQKHEAGEAFNAEVGWSKRPSSKVDLVMDLSDLVNSEALGGLEGLMTLAKNQAVVDVVFFLGGQTLEPPPETPPEGEAPPRMPITAPTPPLVLELNDVLQSNPPDEMANTAIRLTSGCHVFDGEEANKDAFNKVIEVASDYCSSKHEYDNWLKNAAVSLVPDLPVIVDPPERAATAATEKSEGAGSATKASETKSEPGEPAPAVAEGERRPVVDTRLYARLMGSVDPCHHDVALFLHCLTEQVSQTLEDGQEEKEEEAKLGDLEAYLAEASTGVGSDCVTVATGSGSRPPTREVDTEPLAGALENLHVNSAPVVPVLDRLACRQLGQKLPTGEDVVAVEHSLLHHLKGPGYRRNMLPAYAPLTSAQRSALRNRIYPFLPVEDPVHAERLLLLREFEDLLSTAQPERSGKWNLMNRVHHEFIPSDLMLQTMIQGLAADAFVATRYSERHDALLVALHYRSPPGRVLWHAWASRVRTKPTFNEWFTMLKGSESPDRLYDLQARRYGFTREVDKLVCPADGSVVVVARQERGLLKSYQWPPPEKSARKAKKLPVEGGDVPETPKTDAEADNRMDEGVTSPSVRSRSQVEAHVFTPEPAFVNRCAKVLKEGMTFGIATDDHWAQRRESMKTARLHLKKQQLQRKRTGSQVDGSAEASDDQESKPPTPAPVVESDDEDPSKVDVEKLEFGQFWLAFSDDSRFSARVDHEAAFPDGMRRYDPGTVTPGVVVSYSLYSGFTLQIFADGSIMQTWPIPSTLDPPKPDPRPTGFRPPPRVKSAPAERHFLPGCPEDIEVSRMIYGHGVVCRRLLSGRIEVMFENGTSATRNPEQAEVEARWEGSRHAAEAPAEFLEHLVESYHAGFFDATRPSADALSAGMPGHWVVTRPDGRRFGRAPQPPPELDLATSPIPEDDDEADDGSLSKAPAPEPVRDQILKALWGLPGARGVEDELVEYELPEVAYAVQVDPDTRQKVLTMETALLRFEEEDSSYRTCMYGDGTRFDWKKTPLGVEVLVEKEGLAKVVCIVEEAAYSPKSTILVEMQDGTIIEVTPQIRDNRGDLTVVDPNKGVRPTNTAVVLKRADGTIVRSTGDGEVHVIAKSIVLDGGEKNALGTSSRTNVYVASCPGNKMELEDEEGNVLELDGYNSLKLMPVKGGQPPSPRCDKPLVPYKHPEHQMLPLPESVPDPRLFIVHGDGETEEILAPSVVEEAVRLAKQDPKATVLADEELPAPMVGCYAHTIYKEASAERPALPLTPCRIPPVVAKPVVEMSEFLTRGSMMHGFATDTTGEIRGIPERPYTMVRQFIQFPSVTDEECKAFVDAVTMYHRWEKEHSGEEQDAKPDKGKKDKNAKDKGKAKDAKGKDTKAKAKKGKKGQEAPPTPPPEEDLPPLHPMRPYELERKVLDARSKQLPVPRSRELLVKTIKRIHAGANGFEDDAMHGVSHEPTDQESTLAPTPPLVGGPSIPSISHSPQPEDPGSPEPLPESPIRSNGATPTPFEGDLDAEQYPLPRASKQKNQIPVPEEPTFHYFTSEMGLKFLMQDGSLPEPGPDKQEKLPTIEGPKLRSPWEPLLPDEYEALEQERLAKEEAIKAREATAKTVHIAAQSQRGGGVMFEGDTRHVRPGAPQWETVGASPPRHAVYGNIESGLVPVRHTRNGSPRGPHPDKKSIKYDVYGDKRPLPEEPAKPFLAPNGRFLAVEAETDRRVRTSSVVLKKNAREAPSAFTVRRTGAHIQAVHQQAYGLVPDVQLSRQDETMTATMQGLGDPTVLVEVQPGQLRFGPLRRGSCYRMSFVIKNLDVDVTRYMIPQPETPLIQVLYQPQPIAPGLSVTAAVEIRCFEAGKLEKLVEVRVKAHIAKVAVFAQIIEADEFDRLDEETLALHGRHITRQSGVELVEDEKYCRRILGAAYVPPVTSLSYVASAPQGPS